MNKTKKCEGRCLLYFYGFPLSNGSAASRLRNTTTSQLSLPAAGELAARSCSGGWPGHARTEQNLTGLPGSQAGGCCSWSLGAVHCKVPVFCLFWASEALTALAMAIPFGPGQNVKLFPPSCDQSNRAKPCIPFFFSVEEICEGCVKKCQCHLDSCLVSP